MPLPKLKGLAPKMCIERFEKLKGDRANFENVWQKIGDYIIPRKNDIQNTRSPGEPIYIDVYDSTGSNSLDLLAGALHGMLTNPAGYFFGLTTGDERLDQNDNVRKYIQDVVRKMHDVLNGSNFQTEVHELYLELIAFGTACMSMEEDDETIIRFSTRAIKEIVVEENSKGFIDSVYRKYKLDARGIVDDFGYDNVPKKVKDAYDKGEKKQFEIVHGVYPSKKYGTNQTNNKFNYISQYVLVCDKVDLEVSGFREFPYLTPRWSKASGESYGRGQGEKALPEVLTANKMVEVTLIGAQKVIDPPLQAPDDGFMMPLLTTPAGLNYYRAGSQDRIEPILNDARIDFGYQVIDQIRGNIREAFFVDQLKLREGPQMTATEVSERVEQALRFLGPMLGRQQIEFLKPLVERLFLILERRGELPEAPAELNGNPLNVMYTSVMAMSQRASELTSIQRFWQHISPFVAADQTVLDGINGDAGLKKVARLVNLPQELVKNIEEIQQVRDERAQAMQQQQEMLQQQMNADNQSKMVGAAAKLQKGA